MGRATYTGNVAKSKMKQPSDKPTWRFELGWYDLWSNVLPPRCPVLTRDNIKLVNDKLIIYPDHKGTE